VGSQDQGADATAGRWLVIPRTLSFVLNDGAVLLMKRAPHKRVFPNRYNGLGGHVERDEDPLAGAVREIREESGLEVRDVRLRGVHQIDTGGAGGILLFTFTAISDTRAITAESPDGTLHWVPFEAAAGLDLVEDLPYILPRVLAMPDDAPPYFVHVSYDADDQIVMRFGDADAR
jgi:8-oxo-dGTP diphosphatase